MLCLTAQMCAFVIKWSASWVWSFWSLCFVS